MLITVGSRQLGNRVVRRWYAARVPRFRGLESPCKGPGTGTVVLDCTACSRRSGRTAEPAAALRRRPDRRNRFVTAESAPRGNYPGLEARRSLGTGLALPRKDGGLVSPFVQPAFK